MTCRELTGFLADYLGADLPATERTRFDAHLAVCPSCRAYLESYRQTVALGKAAFADPDAAVPADVPEQLVRAILAARRSK